MKLNGINKFIWLVLAGILMITGCSPTDNQNVNTGSGDAARGIDSNESVNSTPATAAPRVLEDKWYQDADKNEVPDFIEIANGYDPANDDCPLVENCGGGTPGDELNQTVNTLLMLDASGSMRAQAGGQRKIDAAKISLNRFVAGMPERVKTGFLVYGHKGDNTPAGKPASCAADGAEILAPIGAVNAQEFEQTLQKFEPTGWTPIGLALEKSREAFTGKTGRNRIIMVSDGIETCGGDPVAVARRLNSEGIKVTIDVVGFDVPSNDQKQLRAIAEAGGGTYFDAKTQAELDEYLKKQQEVYMKTMSDLKCLQQALIDVRSCEFKFTTSANNRITEEENAILKTAPEKYSEISIFKTRILNLQEKRFQTYDELRQKISERSDQSREILEQGIRSIGKSTKR